MLRINSLKIDIKLQVSHCCSLLFVKLSLPLPPRMVILALWPIVAAIAGC